MNNELIIDASQSEVVIALLNDKRLVELHRERTNNNFSVGDIYLGRVKKVMAGLNACFVDVGYEKDAFLHYFDLGPQVTSVNKYVKLTQSRKIHTSLLANFHNEKTIPKNGKISSVVQQNNSVLVQISKEPISTKGPRITTEISIAGRYLVLVPFLDTVSISQKIRNPEERNRLKRLIASIKPKNFGIIIRTVAEDKSVADLHTDLNDLVKKWDACFMELKMAKPPKKVLGEMNRTASILRDLLNESFSSIHVNNEKIFEEIKSYLHTIAPDKEKIVQYDKGKTSIFEHFGVDKQIKALFGRNVTMKSGAYLIIEHTEAMHVIDVNSGHRTHSGKDQETNALETNLDAAEEVARQLRLRDMGGIIVVDFIDLHNPNNRRILFDKIRGEMSKDRAKHNILPPSKFGLVQITRQRVRPEMNVETQEKCPACSGTGEVSASILLTDQIENNLAYIVKEQNQKNITLCVHPFTEAYLTRGILSSLKRKWRSKYKTGIEITPVSAYHMMEYHFFNKAGEEIKL